MSLFGKHRGLFGGSMIGPIGSDLFDDGPDIANKVKMLFKDVETEGKKQGYDRAAREYGEAYRAIENEFLETKKIIEQQKSSYDNTADLLISKLGSLERKRASLKKQVDDKANEVSRGFDIPVEDVKNSMASATLSLDIIGLVYKHREKKLKEAEQRGYAEAKILYENKINKLKEELRRLKENGDRDIQSLVSLIDEVFSAIAAEQMKIAELSILL